MVNLRTVLFLSALLPVGALARAPGLSMDRLAEPLKALTSGDRSRVDRAVELIRRGEHLAAFTPLLEVTKANPKNSGVRVVLAYTLLQLGNVAGAFDHAQLAEKTANGNAYVCLFLARVASIIGDASMCRRELEHASGDASLKAEVSALRKDLEKH